MILPIIMCLHPLMSTPDTALVHAAVAARYVPVILTDESTKESLDSQVCDVVVLPTAGESAVYPGMILYHVSSRHGRNITRRHARDILLAWGQFERTALELRAASTGLTYDDGVSDVYDFFAEGGML